MTPLPHTTPILPARYGRDDSGGVVVVEPAVACPELLTESETIRYLRLDTVDGVDTKKTLERYRSAGTLRPTRLSRKLFYHIDELRRFVRLQTDQCRSED